MWFYRGVKNSDSTVLSMDIETREVEKGVEIYVETDQRVALVVETGEEERIYLPEPPGSNSSYYVENTQGLAKTENGYQVLHTGNLDSISVIN